MAQVISDRRDIEFVIHEQLDAESLSQLHENFADFNKKTINLIISEA
ncbi:MAG: acyl-CoA dehydrogenase N-terminal domain-containing protein, partial [Proteobacteria bacterium]|nr:acyl-CoA dehydrogenase N-terminal domain-containing protein [Pseudomonadota bacterium]